MKTKAEECKSLLASLQKPRSAKSLQTNPFAILLQDVYGCHNIMISNDTAILCSVIQFQDTYFNILIYCIRLHVYCVYCINWNGSTGM